MKNNSGFSLVELIVVIAIMAILAGVAVPTYTKYIAKANDTKVLAELDEIKTAAIAVAAGDGETVATVAITISTSAVNVTCTADEGETAKTYAAADLTDYVDNTTVSFDGTSYEKKTTLTWSAATGEWTAS